MKKLTKQPMLELIKEQMKLRIEEVTFDTFHKEKEEMDKFFKLIEALHDVSFETITAVIPEPIEETKEEESKDLPENPNSNIGKEFTFERKIRGGVVLGLENGYMISEKMVRDMGVENGDKLLVTDERIQEPRNFYWFKIVEKVNLPVPNREEHIYCKVEKDFGEFVIKGSQRGTIRIDEIPMTFIIDDRDIEIFNLKDGDIVDIAFYNNKPTETMRVIHKYEIGETIQPTVEQRKLSSSERAEKTIHVSQIEKEIPYDEKLFKGKNILIVGAESRRVELEEAFENLGAKFNLLTGDEGKERMEATISKADAVGIAYRECSHSASIFTSNACKQKVGS